MPLKKLRNMSLILKLKERAMTVSELTEGLGNHWSWHQGA
jgi:hypothetical protein